MGKYYRFAGLELAVKLPDGKEFAREGALAPFAVDSVTQPHLFDCRLVDELTPPQGQCIHNDGGFRVYREGAAQVRYIGSVQKNWDAAYLRVAHQGKSHRVELKKQTYGEEIRAKAVLTAMSVEHLLAQEGSFIFHSSYVEWEGGAILFTAPSGTGKSTQAELWRSLRGAEVINGDRAAVRLENGQVLADGVPFSGSSPYCKNRSLPLKAIVYLAQAPVTTISRLQGVRAFARIWEGVSVNVWDKEDVAKVSRTVEALVQQVPVYYLPCTPDETAVIALEQQLRK